MTILNKKIGDIPPLIVDHHLISLTQTFQTLEKSKHALRGENTWRDFMTLFWRCDAFTSRQWNYHSERRRLKIKQRLAVIWKTPKFEAHFAVCTLIMCLEGKRCFTWDFPEIFDTLCLHISALLWKKIRKSQEMSRNVMYGKKLKIKKACSWSNQILIALCDWRSWRNLMKNPHFSKIRNLKHKIWTKTRREWVCDPSNLLNTLLVIFNNNLSDDDLK